MKIEVIPLNIRKIKHNSLGNYAEYLDELIGMKLREWNKMKSAITPRRTLKKVLT